MNSLPLACPNLQGSLQKMSNHLHEIELLLEKWIESPDLKTKQEIEHKLQQVEEKRQTFFKEYQQHVYTLLKQWWSIVNPSLSTITDIENSQTRFAIFMESISLTESGHLIFDGELDLTHWKVEYLPLLFQEITDDFYLSPYLTSIDGVEKIGKKLGLVKMAVEKGDSLSAKNLQFIGTKMFSPEFPTPFDIHSPQHIQKLSFPSLKKVPEIELSDVRELLIPIDIHVNKLTISSKDIDVAVSSINLTESVMIWSNSFSSPELTHIDSLYFQRDIPNTSENTDGSLNLPNLHTITNKLEIRGNTRGNAITAQLDHLQAIGGSGLFLGNIHVTVPELETIGKDLYLNDLAIQTVDQFKNAFPALKSIGVDRDGTSVEVRSEAIKKYLESKESGIMFSGKVKEIL